MDRCVTDEPPLAAVNDQEGFPDLGHTSACWLPHEAAGLGAEAERIRQEAVAESRSAQETAGEAK
jgi:hypothetical protein